MQQKNPEILRIFLFLYPPLLFNTLLLSINQYNSHITFIHLPFINHRGKVYTKTMLNLYQSYTKSMLTLYQVYANSIQNLFLTIVWFINNRPSGA
jgi:hypothetical protein